MKFGDFQIDARKPGRMPPPLLIIFADNLTEQCVIGFLFREAYRLSQDSKNVYWIRPQPSTNLAHIDDDVLVNPKWLDKISLRYDSGQPLSALVQFCCEDIYKLVITPHCIFVEIINSRLSIPELASVLALLSHTSKWIASKRPTDPDSFTVAVVLRDNQEFRMCASLFSEYLVKLNDHRLTRIL